MYRTIIDETVKEMLEYLGDRNDCGYDVNDIKVFRELTVAFCEKEISSRDDMIHSIKRYVESLNTLNKNCDLELIETDQRENIVEIIMSISSTKGYDNDSDVTEKFREW